MTPVFTYLSWSILGENNGVLQPRVKTCSVATRFDAKKKKNSFRGEKKKKNSFRGKKKKLVSLRKTKTRVATRFLAEKKNTRFVATPRVSWLNLTMGLATKLMC